MRKNSEGYSDPTAEEAIKEADKAPDHVQWFLKTVKIIAALVDLEVIGRICVRDKSSKREYR